MIESRGPNVKPLTGYDVRKLRERLNMGRDEFCKLTGVDSSLLRLYEHEEDNFIPEEVTEKIYGSNAIRRIATKVVEREEFIVFAKKLRNE